MIYAIALIIFIPSLILVLALCRMAALFGTDASDSANPNTNTNTKQIETHVSTTDSENDRAA